MAEATPRGTGKGVFKTRPAPEIRTRERDLVPDLEDFHESEKEELDRTKVDLMEACVAWEGLRSSLRKVKEDQFQRKLIDFGEDVYKIRLYLEDTKGADLSQELLKETKKTLIILKFELGGFIDWLHNFLELSSVKRGDKGRTELTPRDYQAINENLNILKRLASREELIIDTRSKILRAETTPAARLTTKTEPIPDSTSAPATALPPDADLPAKAGEPKAVVDPTISTASTTSTEPTPTVATPATIIVTGEPDPATATTPDSSAAAPDTVAGRNSNSGDTSNPVGGPDSTQTSHEADPGVVFEHYGLWSEKDADIKLSQEVIDALEQIESKEGGLYTVPNLLKYVVSREGKELLPDRSAANTLLDLLIREGIVT